MKIGQLEVRLTAEDFTNLWEQSMDWGVEWKSQAERFDNGISFHWQKAYFFELCYANFVLARTYLKGIGVSFEVTNDAAGGWVILTDYDWSNS
jgi:hypothetical protein